MWQEELKEYNVYYSLIRFECKNTKNKKQQ